MSETRSRTCVVAFAVAVAAAWAVPAAADRVIAASRSHPSLVSAAAGGELSDSRQKLSHDGRFLVFESLGGADLLPSYSGADRQVFLLDRQSDTIALVSTSTISPLRGGNAASRAPVISRNGAFVAFSSFATDLVTGGSGLTEFENLYVWERATGTITLVSGSDTTPGERGNNLSGGPAFSDDGAFLAFRSYATNLLAGGSGPGWQNVYLWERASGVATLVSESVLAPGQRANHDSYDPAISSDGAFVVFQSVATDLVPGGSGPTLTQNVYLWERGTGAATLVSESVASPAQRGNDDSWEPVISSNGAFVAFFSEATDLTPGESGPDISNVYLWERATGAATLVSESVSAPGQRGNGTSRELSLSSDGAFVAFRSSATDLVTGESGPGFLSVYLWERSSGLSTLVSESVAAAGQRANGNSDLPKISDNGSFVAFRSRATDLVSAGNGPASRNAYVWERATGEATLASESAASSGQRGDKDSSAPAISGDGAFVAFMSEAADLVPEIDLTTRDVFLYERSSGLLTLASRRDSGTTWSPVTGNGPSGYGPTTGEEFAISANGGFVVFPSASTVLTSGESGPATVNFYLFERETGATTLVSESGVSAGQRGNGDSRRGAISADGAFVAFLSYATDLVPGGSGPPTQNVYLWERATGSTTLVSKSVSAPGQRANGDSYELAISDDGSFVAFYARATDLTPGENGPQDFNIYLWERGTAATTLVSRSTAAPGQRGDGSSFLGEISAAADHVVFSSDASDLVPGGLGTLIQNIYLWTRATGAMTLVTAAVPGSGGPGGNSSSSRPRISSDGAFVAFDSDATNLVPGESGPAHGNVYLWERAAGANTLVSESVAAPNQRANHFSYEPEIGGDGAFVVYSSQASDLVPTSGGPGSLNIYLWERATGAATLVSESILTPGQRGNGTSEKPEISEDGAVVVFASRSTDIATGLSGAANYNIYRWDRATETVLLVSESATATGQRGNADTEDAAVSDNGAFVAFASQASNLVDRDWNYTWDVFLGEATAIFLDRFESADTSRWSETVQ